MKALSKGGKSVHMRNWCLLSQCMLYYFQIKISEWVRNFVLEKKRDFPWKREIIQKASRQKISIRRHDLNNCKLVNQWRQLWLDVWRFCYLQIYRRVKGCNGLVLTLWANEKFLVYINGVGCHNLSGFGRFFLLIRQIWWYV